MSTSLFFLAMVLVGYIAQLVDGALGMGYGVFSALLLVTYVCKITNVIRGGQL